MYRGWCEGSPKGTGGSSPPPPAAAHYRGGTPRRRGAVRKASPTAAQAGAWAGGGFDAGHGRGLDGVGRPQPNRLAHWPGSSNVRVNNY
jgi:hypothetical protein